MTPARLAEGERDLPFRVPLLLEAVILALNRVQSPVCFELDFEFGEVEIVGVAEAL